MTEQRSERLPRAQRREQILAAATTAFARAGFAATSLDDVAREAGISRMIVYRHFESKRDLYREALERVGDMIGAATRGEISINTLRAFVATAAAEPDGFRLLFRHAAREPEFSADIDTLLRGMSAATYEQIASRISDPVWANWAATCIPVVLVEAIMAWLDAGQPDPETAPDRIGQAIRGVVGAAGRVNDAGTNAGQASGTDTGAGQVRDTGTDAGQVNEAATDTDQSSDGTDASRVRGTGTDTDRVSNAGAGADRASDACADADRVSDPGAGADRASDTGAGPS